MVPLVFCVSNPPTTASAPSNGEGVSLFSITPKDLSDTQGWWTVEIVLIRFETGSIPSGRFPVYFKIPNHVNGVEDLKVGYDAAVCVQRYEPWIIETYNTSIASPSTLRVVGKGNGGTPLLPSGKIRGAAIASTRYLNTTGKHPAFLAAHDNSVDQMWKVNVLGDFLGYYLPSATVGPGMSLYTTFL